MTVHWVPVRDVLRLERRQCIVEPANTYAEVGVRSFGRGLFTKEDVSGVSLGEKRVFFVRAGDLIVSNVFAWEGAVGLAAAEHDGLVGSHRFMTWVTTSKDASSRYLLEYFRSRPGTAALASVSPGSAGRNRTLSISNFEALTVPLVSPPCQERIAAHLDALSAAAANDARLRTDSPLGDSGRATSILPRLLGDAWRELDLPTVALGELCSNTHGVVHPGRPLQGAEIFVGLEHIEPHTGRAIGSRPIADETGRKILFLPGTVTYGYLRPYLNKVWVPDRTGLCSVDQYVLAPAADVDPHLLASLLRSDLVWGPAKTATNRLQLPRLNLPTLLGFRVPDIRELPEASTIGGTMERLTDLVATIAATSDRRSHLADAILPAARNEIFGSLLRG